jgi:hypothetical protein
VKAFTASGPVAVIDESVHLGMTNLVWGYKNSVRSLLGVTSTLNAAIVPSDDTGRFIPDRTWFLND